MAHCSEHDLFNGDCGNCRISRLIELDQQQNKCICPILSPTPGGCPVHGG